MTDDIFVLDMDDVEPQKQEKQRITARTTDKSLKQQIVSDLIDPPHLRLRSVGSGALPAYVEPVAGAVTATGEPVYRNYKFATTTDGRAVVVCWLPPKYRPYAHLPAVGQPHEAILMPPTQAVAESEGRALRSPRTYRPIRSVIVTAVQTNRRHTMVEVELAEE